MIQSKAEAELAGAAAMDAAAEAVDCLRQGGMLTELKSLPKPPAGVDMVTKACCLILVENEFKNHKWDRAKKMMANVDQFKQSLADFRGEDITEDEIKRIEPFHQHRRVLRREHAVQVGGRGEPVQLGRQHLHGFNRIYVKVKPLMDSLEEAKASKAEADASLAKAQESVASVEAELAKLQEKLQAGDRGEGARRGRGERVHGRDSASPSASSAGSRPRTSAGASRSSGSRARA